MDYRLFGRTGVKVAPLALGTANFGRPTPEEESERILNEALDAGINLIDTANAYAGGESERIIGRVLARNGKRDQVFLATKVHFPTGPGPNDRGNSRLHVMQACEASLRRLQVDHIDLYQLHRPDPQTPIEETLSALTDLVRQGKVRYVGCSTFPAWGVMEALLTSELRGLVRFASEQPPYNLLDRRIENELVPLAQAHELALIPWSPMAMGILAGRYDDERAYPTGSRAALEGGIYAERVTARGIALGRAFSQVAQEAGLSAAQLAILWVKDQPGITAPLVGPRTLDQLEHLLPVLKMKLPADVRQACDALVPPGSAAVNFHNTAPWMKMAVT
ncbi:MAG: aldo/keto reductase [Chloroflexi bacterium]|jgi:aryl-alcohol dehydrogenase-like predicted oxidoreductase|nr:aldo/keto reductase [Chloroflexota bacterium]